MKNACIDADEPQNIGSSQIYLRNRQVRSLYFRRMIDFIGDVHGHADKLTQLLERIGYSHKNGTYAHPTRTVLFVGDYIDRGPQIRETLAIIKSMVDSKNAVALMGNHEYNALCFHTQEREGGHLRKHLIKNVIQHYETLRQFQNRQDEYEAYLEWFKTLPLFYETETFRAVHACWDADHITHLRSILKSDRLDDELIHLSAQKDSTLNHAIEETLKGKEMMMPNGLFFHDKDGEKRSEIRIKWWEDPASSTYQSISVERLETLPGIPVDMNSLKSNSFYNPSDKPVFFGHYWLKGNPVLFRDNICCLDYSVAKHGFLVAYRFDEEQKLDAGKLVYV